MMRTGRITMGLGAVIIAAVGSCLLAVSSMHAQEASKQQPRLGDTKRPFRSRGSEEDQLRYRGYESSQDGLRQALAGTDWWTRVLAIRIAKKKDVKELVPELEQQLKHESTHIRVEAGMALVKFGNPTGNAALQKEVVRGSELLQAVLDGKEPLLGRAGLEISFCVRGAGGLADAGDSSGFDLVKAALLHFPLYASGMEAVQTMPKFARFKDKGIDVLPLLLQATDAVIKQVDEYLAKGQTNGLGAARGNFSNMAHALAEVGGQEAAAKLTQASQHKDDRISSEARAYLHALEEKMKSPIEKPENTPQKSSSPGSVPQSAK